VVLTDGVLIDAHDLGLNTATPNATHHSLAQARDAFERELVRETLRAHGRRIAPAARQLGISRVTLYRLVARFNLADDLAPEEQTQVQTRVADHHDTTGTGNPVAKDHTARTTNGLHRVTEPSQDRIRA
jgi:hypothetical protein